MKAAIIGGGAAGFFAAINIKEMRPDISVTIIEKSTRVLRKVEISGGGRCNCTNTFANVRDLKHVYPRGHQAMKRLMHTFDNNDAQAWFERHGIPLTTQEDQCIFPKTQDSHTIINTFLNEARRHNIRIITNKTIDDIDQLSEYDIIVVATGGAQDPRAHQWLARTGHKTEPPIPSLYSLRIDDTALTSLAGTVAGSTKLRIADSKATATGTLLITHWGISGPATQHLTSQAARHLHQNSYSVPIAINWTGQSQQEAARQLQETIAAAPDKSLRNQRPCNLSRRLWEHIIGKTIPKTTTKWKDLSAKQQRQLVNTLTNDTYHVSGRASHRDEIVTCGGIALSDINLPSMQSKLNKKLYFAGEILDIDGTTGGFNLQAAWTTAYCVALAISRTI